MAFLPVETRTKALAYIEAFQYGKLQQVIQDKLQDVRIRHNPFPPTTTEQLQTNLATSAENGNVGNAAVAAIRLLRQSPESTSTVATYMAHANETAIPLYEATLQTVSQQPTNWLARQMRRADLEVDMDKVGRRARRWGHLALEASGASVPQVA